MYNNWNSLFDKAKTVANVAGKKTEELVETSKLKLQRFSINTDIQTLYEKMGEITYRSHKMGIETSDEITHCVEEIDSLLAALADLEAQISEIQKLKNCPNCGAHCSIDSLFCPQCGSIIGTPRPPRNDEDEEENTENKE